MDFLMTKAFHLKHFSIRQERAAMKVGTDGILLPAWVSEIQQDYIDKNIKVLDIGAGTGIISLMLAQVFPKAKVVALEIDEGACADARENIENSPFAERIKLLKQDFLTYKTSEKFDLIVSNPPYFAEAGATAPLGQRALARQEQVGGFTLAKLMQKAKSMLSADVEACLFMITPLDREADLRLYACENLLRAKQLCRVSSKEGKPVRLLSQWTKQNLSADYMPTKLTNLTLHSSEQKPTLAYARLLSPFF